MPQTHGVGKLFWHKIRLDKLAPLHHKHPTQEYEPPFRCGPGHIFRLPCTRLGVVVGRWWYAVSDELEGDTLMSVLNAHVERPDVVGEGGTTIDAQRELQYAHVKAELPGAKDRYNGWTVR